MNYGAEWAVIAGLSVFGGAYWFLAALFRKVASAVAPTPSRGVRRIWADPIESAPPEPAAITGVVVEQIESISPELVAATGVFVELIETRDWDGARRFLQKMAYGMVDAPERAKREFTELMKAFSTVDPLYKECMEVVRPLVAASPGVRQTELYEHMPVDDLEQARYVLYFAHQLGHIARRKKGNSYEVFPEDFAVELVASSTKRTRARKR